MLLLELTRVQHDKDDASKSFSRPMTINADLIVTMFDHKEGTTISLQGFTSSIVVKETRKEIEDAIYSAKDGEYEAQYAALIISLGGSVFIDAVNRLVRPPVIVGSGALPDAEAMRNVPGSLQLPD